MSFILDTLNVGPLQPPVSRVGKRDLGVSPMAMNVSISHGVRDGAQRGCREGTWAQVGPWGADGGLERRSWEGGGSGGENGEGTARGERAEEGRPGRGVARLRSSLDLETGRRRPSPRRCWEK